MITRDQFTALKTIFEIAKRQNFNVYVVGGIIRDLLLNSKTSDPDIDLTVEGDAGRLAELAALELSCKVKFFPEFLTAKMIKPEQYQIDLASTRTEVYVIPGALPVVTQSDLSADLKRRDFTINALAIELGNFIECLKNPRDLEQLKSQVIDHFSGKVDLAAGLVKIIHAKSFSDDPTRIFRALKYVARINGKLAADTEELLISALLTDALLTINGNRIHTELRKIFEDPQAVIIIELLKRYGVLDKIFEIVDYNMYLFQLYRLAKYTVKIGISNLMSVQLALLLLNCKPNTRFTSLKKLDYSDNKINKILEKITKFDHPNNLDDFLDFEILFLLGYSPSPVIEREANLRKIL